MVGITFERIVKIGKGYCKKYGIKVGKKSPIQMFSEINKYEKKQKLKKGMFITKFFYDKVMYQARHLAKKGKKGSRKTKKSSRKTKKSSRKTKKSSRKTKKSSRKTKKGKKKSSKRKYKKKKKYMKKSKKKSRRKSR